MDEGLTMPEKVAIWRQKAIEGTLTLEDRREALRHLRADRTSGLARKTTKKEKAPVLSGEQLLNLLDDII